MYIYIRINVYISLVRYLRNLDHFNLLFSFFTWPSIPMDHGPTQLSDTVIINFFFEYKSVSSNAYLSVLMTLFVTKEGDCLQHAATFPMHVDGSCREQPFAGNPHGMHGCLLCRVQMS